MIERRSRRSLRSVNWPRVMRLTSIKSSIRRTSCEILPLHHAGRMPAGLRELLHAQDLRNVAQGSQRIAQLVRERREEFILEL
jgi:hypothetical protein